MTRDSITVRAQVHLLPTLESGRRGSYRPNHNFFGPNGHVMAVGFIEFPDEVELHPGETIELPITFWCGPELEGQIYPGREWRIQEGPFLVGTGRVIEVLD